MMSCQTTWDLFRILLWLMRWSATSRPALGETLTLLLWVVDGGAVSPHPRLGCPGRRAERSVNLRMLVDCWGCRGTSARFCAACVSQALSERHARLRDFASDKKQLEASMAEAIAAREALLRQRAERRTHRALIDELNMELKTIKRESRCLEEEIVALRQAVSGSSSPSAAATGGSHSNSTTNCCSNGGCNASSNGTSTAAGTALPSSSQSPAAAETRSASAASVDLQLTERRKRLVRELLQLYHGVWLEDSSGERSCGSSAIFYADGRSHQGEGAEGAQEAEGGCGGSASTYGAGRSLIAVAGDLTSWCISSTAAAAAPSATSAAINVAAADDGAGASISDVLREGWREGLRAARGAAYSTAAAHTAAAQSTHAGAGFAAPAASVDHLAASLATLSAASPSEAAIGGSSGGRTAAAAAAAAAGSSGFGSWINPSGSRAQARDLGMLVLLVQAAASYLGVGVLPFKLVFQASDSIVWHPTERRPLPLNPEACTPNEWRLAVRLLEANVMFVIDHVPNTPLGPPLASSPLLANTADLSGVSSHPNGADQADSTTSATLPALRATKRAGGAPCCSPAHSASLSNPFASATISASAAAAAAWPSSTAESHFAHIDAAEEVITSSPKLSARWLLRAATSGLASRASVMAGGVVDAVVRRAGDAIGGDGALAVGRAAGPTSTDGEQRGTPSDAQAADLSTATAGVGGRCGDGLASDCGLSSLSGVVGGDGVVSGLDAILDAPSLAWELHTSSCPLWGQSERDNQLSGTSAYGDEWAVVERPRVPPPGASPDAIGQYEASMLPVRLRPAV